MGRSYFPLSTSALIKSVDPFCLVLISPLLWIDDVPRFFAISIDKLEKLLRDELFDESQSLTEFY